MKSFLCVLSPYHPHTVFALKIARRNTLWTLKKTQIFNSVFYVYFNMEKSRYNFGRRLFKDHFGGLGVKIILQHRGLDDEYGRVIFIFKLQKRLQI